MEIIKEFFGKFKNNKGVLLILIIGAVLLLVPSQGKKEDTKKQDYIYEEKLKDELERTLSEIEGAGKTSVMITFSDKGKIYPLTDKSETGQNINEKTVSVSGKVAVLKEAYPSVRGVVVIAKGGGNELVKENIINAVSALTGAPFHQIKVFKMEE
jgi:stage III sporulation protein AG